MHKVVRYRDATHLRAIVGTEVLPAAERLYENLKPRAVIYQRTAPTA